MNPLYIGGASAPKASIKRITKIDPRFQNQPKYVFTEETVQYLKQPSFNNWQWEENEMTALMENMFFELGLVDHFKIDLPTLKRFLITVKDNYNVNPFHNFRHCFCVTQMVCNTKSNLQYHFTHLDDFRCTVCCTLVICLESWITWISLP